MKRAITFAGVLVLLLIGLGIFPAKAQDQGMVGQIGGFQTTSDQGVSIGVKFDQQDQIFYMGFLIPIGSKYDLVKVEAQASQGCGVYLNITYFDQSGKVVEFPGMNNIPPSEAIYSLSTDIQPGKVGKWNGRENVYILKPQQAWSAEYYYRIQAPFADKEGFSLDSVKKKIILRTQ